MKTHKQVGRALTQCSVVPLCRQEPSSHLLDNEGRRREKGAGASRAISHGVQELENRQEKRSSDWLAMELRKTVTRE